MEFWLIAICMLWYYQQNPSGDQEFDAFCFEHLLRHHSRGDND